MLPEIAIFTFILVHREMLLLKGDGVDQVYSKTGIGATISRAVSVTKARALNFQVRHRLARQIQDTSLKSIMAGARSIKERARTMGTFSRIKTRSAKMADTMRKEVAAFGARLIPTEVRAKSPRFLWIT